MQNYIDALVVPWNEEEEVVIAADNSGSIGTKPMDDVHTTYQTVGYFAFRVAYMECVAREGEPFAIILQNFNTQQAWGELKAGVYQGLEEAEMETLPITGSTETNFSLNQSATSLTVLGKKTNKAQEEVSFPEAYRAAVIGKPLVGDEVIEKKEHVAPLSLFQWFFQQKEVIGLIPVGSKGIAATFNRIEVAMPSVVRAKLDVFKSSGPATCFIVLYEDSFYNTAISTAGDLFYG